MSVLKFREGRTTEAVLARLAEQAPVVVSEARLFLEYSRNDGVHLSLTEAGLERLDDLLRRLASRRRSHKRLSRGAGAFFGCLLVERLGGLWRSEDGQWVIAEIGPRRYSYDPFEATQLLLAGRGEVRLRDELDELRDDARGDGPRARFEAHFEQSYERLTGRPPGERVSGFCYRTGQDEWIHLGNIYRRAAPEPDSWPVEIDNFIRKLEGASLEKPRLDGKLCQRIFPALEPRKQTARDLIQIPVLGELSLIFVLDHLRSMSFISLKEARSWGLDASALRRLAFDNLGRRNFGLQVDRRRVRLTVNENDGYDAVRVFLPGFAARARSLLGPATRLALPHRDLLVAFDPSHSDLARLRAEVAALYRTRPYALSPRIYRLDEPGASLPP